MMSRLRFFIEQNSIMSLPECLYSLTEKQEVPQPVHFSQLWILSPNHPNIHLKNPSLKKMCLFRRFLTLNLIYSTTMAHYPIHLAHKTYNSLCLTSHRVSQSHSLRLSSLGTMETTDRTRLDLLRGFIRLTYNLINIVEIEET